MPILSIVTIGTITTPNQVDTKLTIDVGDVVQPQIEKPGVFPSNYGGVTHTSVITLPSVIATQRVTPTNSFSGFEVYVTPTDRLLDFGFITETSTILIDITNYGDTTITIDDIAYLSTAGIIISGGGVGTSILPGATLILEVSAYSDQGAIAINSLLAIIFDNGVSINYVLIIIRSSAFVYSLEPTLTSYVESITFKTEVVIYTNGAEVRNALMDIPKKMISYNATAYSNAMMNYGNNILHFGFYTRMYQPLWLQHTKINTPLNGNEITLDTTGRDYVVGDSVVIQNDSLYPVVVEVTQVFPTYIIIKFNIRVQAPYFVAPAVLCIQPKSNGYNTSTTTFGEFSFKLEEV